MKYIVMHTTDQLGGVYASPMQDYETDDLKQAQADAKALSDKGQCGFVVRSEDNARWHPYLGWMAQP